MTQLKEETLKMIERLPDDKMIYIFNILQNIEAMSLNEVKTDYRTSKEAFQTLMQFKKTLPEDFDYKEELEKAKDEKYESTH